MDQPSPTNSKVPVQTTSPEEDATLLAIEALEARSVDPNPRPLHAPRDVPVPERRPASIPTAPTPTVVPPTPKVIEPIVAKPIIEPPVVIAPISAPAPVQPKPQVAPAHIIPAKPKKKGTPSEEMAEELASAPASSGFQFFANQKPPRKPFIIVGLVLIVIAIGVGAYFTLG